MFSEYLPLIGEQSIQITNGSEGKKRRQLHDKAFTNQQVVTQLPMIQQVGLQ